jgi:hypothetical protein
MIWGMSRNLFLAVFFICALLLTPVAYAETLQSNNYRIDESSIGTSGPIGEKSTNFGISSATGDLGVGNSASSNFQINAGTKTDASPTLAFSVNTTLANFGVFSPNTTAVATASFSVLNYSSYGYAVQVFGNTPTNGSHAIAAMNPTGLSQAGTEQFGLNLVANTSPASLGANPDNGSFGFGSVDSNYNVPNNFRFVSGETVAQAAKSSGTTNYTISYVVNVEGLTPGGQYRSNQTLVVLGTY